MIVAIPFNQNDWQRAERLMDCIYWTSAKKPNALCLLVPDALLHQEFKLKVRIAAELAFPMVEMIDSEFPKPGDKVSGINAAFRTACRHIFQSYRHPWLWLEADCVPVAGNWLKALFSAYENQPKRFMGRYLKANSGTFMSRVGIYPPDAYRDLESAVQGAAPFERVANILPRCANTQLIHMEKWSPEKGIPHDAVLINGDRTGALVESMIEATETKTTKKAA